MAIEMMPLDEISHDARGNINGPVSAPFGVQTNPCRNARHPAAHRAT